MFEVTQGFVMTSHSLSQDPLVLSPVGAGLAQRWLGALSDWRRRAGQRQALARMQAWDMRDLGLGQADVWRETRKWPWQP